MYKYVKRILDFVFALVLLVILFIPMCIIAILIKICDGGPVIYKQERTGLNGKNFNIYKFRTMDVNNDIYYYKTDDSITKIGSVIKKFSLDELPQIINIIKGDMSFVGPRPWIIEYYENMNAKQRNRTKVLPGLTGLAQVNGRNNISIFKKIEYDLIYVDNYSFTMDLYILLKTVVTIFKKENEEIGKKGIRKEINLLKKQKGRN